MAWEEPAEPLLPDEAAALAARLERLERRRESLGAVNPLAAEEYEQEKVRGRRPVRAVRRPGDLAGASCAG